MDKFHTRNNPNLKRIILFFLVFLALTFSVSARIIDLPTGYVAEIEVLNKTNTYENFEIIFNLSLNKNWTIDNSEFFKPKITKIKDTPDPESWKFEIQREVPYNVSASRTVYNVTNLSTTNLSCDIGIEDNIFKRQVTQQNGSNITKLVHCFYDFSQLDNETYYIEYLTEIGTNLEFRTFNPLGKTIPGEQTYTIKFLGKKIQRLGENNLTVNLSVMDTGIELGNLDTYPFIDEVPDHTDNETGLRLKLDWTNDGWTQDKKIYTDKALYTGKEITFLVNITEQQNITIDYQAKPDSKIRWRQLYYFSGIDWRTTDTTLEISKSTIFKQFYYAYNTKEKFNISVTGDKGFYALSDPVIDEETGYWRDLFDDETGIEEKINTTINSGKIRLSGGTKQIFDENWDDNDISDWTNGNMGVNSGYRYDNAEPVAFTWKTIDNENITNLTEFTFGGNISIGLNYINIWVIADESTDPTAGYALSLSKETNEVKVYIGNAGGLKIELCSLAFTDWSDTWNNFTLTRKTNGNWIFQINGTPYGWDSEVADLTYNTTERIDIRIDSGPKISEVWLDIVGDYVSNGNLTSVSITPTHLGEWNTLCANGSYPQGTNVTFQIFNASDNANITSYNYIHLNSGGDCFDISGLSTNFNSTILFLNSSTTNLSNTFEVYDWNISWNTSVYISQNETIPTTPQFAPKNTTFHINATSTADVLYCNITLSYEPNNTRLLDNINMTWWGDYWNYTYIIDADGTWNWSVDCIDSYGQGATMNKSFSVTNSIPENLTCSISPSPAETSDNLTANATGSDPEGKNPTWSWIWIVNNVSTENITQVLGSGNITAGMNVSVQCNASDGYNNTLLNSSTLFIGDSTTPTMENFTSSSTPVNTNTLVYFYLDAIDEGSIGWCRAWLYYWDDDGATYDDNITLTLQSRNQYRGSKILDTIGTWGYRGAWCRDGSGNIVENLSVGINISVTAPSTPSSPSSGGSGGSSQTTTTTILAEEFKVEPRKITETEDTVKPCKLLFGEECTYRITNPRDNYTILTVYAKGVTYQVETRSMQSSNFIFLNPKGEIRINSSSEQVLRIKEAMPLDVDKTKVYEATVYIIGSEKTEEIPVTLQWREKEEINFEEMLGEPIFRWVGMIAGYQQDVIFTWGHLGLILLGVVIIIVFIPTKKPKRLPKGLLKYSKKYRKMLGY